MSSLVGDIYFRLNVHRRLERIWKIAHIDFKKRYYDSFLGLFWALLNPLFRLGIYYFIFTTFFSEGRIENFALYLFSGLITFLYFKELSTNAMTIFNSKRYLIESIQISKIDLFYSSAISCTIGYLFNLFAFVLMSLFFSIQYSFNVLYMIPIIITICIMGTAFGIILATIRIFFKDIVQFWMMASLLMFWSCPIFYRGEAIIEKVPIIMYLNPMSGVIHNVRPVLMYATPPDFFWIIYTFCFAVLLYLISLVVLKKGTKKVLENL